MVAVMQKTPANVQPSNRGPTSEAGWATATGRTNVNSAAVDAVAAWGDTIPVNSTAKPTTAIVMTAATLWVDTTVPSTVKQAPTTKSPPYEASRTWGRPVNSTRRRSANEPKAPNNEICGSEKIACVSAKTIGMTTAARTDRLITRRSGSLERILPTTPS